METFDKILKHFAFIIVFLVHAILLIALSFITFKAFKSSIVQEKKSNTAPIYFKSDKKPNELIKTASSEIYQPNKTNVPIQTIKPIKKATIQPVKKTNPVVKQKPKILPEKKELLQPKIDPVRNIIPEKKAERPVEEVDERDILERSIESKKLTTNINKKSKKAKMSSKDFLRQACNIYDSNRYKDQQRAYKPDSFQANNPGQNSGQSRHEQVLQERIAYWADHAYIEMLCEAIVEESNRHKDNYVYYNNSIDDIFPLSFSITADGKLHEIEYLTGLADVDRHLEAILRKTKFPINKNCSIYQYKCNLRIQARRGLGQMKIERAYY